MAKNKNLRSSDLTKVVPKTESQEKVFDAYRKGKHLMLLGFPGTGKTFIALYLALKDVLNRQYGPTQIMLIRSAVPTRDIGFLPGDIDEKTDVYQTPYMHMMYQMFENTMEPYDQLIADGTIEFAVSSFLRGVTLDNKIVIVDEAQNLNFHELDSVITRVGENTRIIFCGDYHQTDFSKEHEKMGILLFENIIKEIKSFECVRFNIGDIVRSGLVKDYIMAKINNLP